MMAPSPEAESLRIPRAGATAKAVSPLPVKYQLFRNGQMIDESAEGYDFLYSMTGESGNYRLVARIELNDQWIPWIYTNPIYIHDQD